MTKVVTTVNMQKSLLHEEKVGWHWHKSWNIPNITISLDVRLEG